MLVDLTNFGLTGKAVEKLLDEAHITANKNTIPNDPQSPFVTSGIRLGTPAVTSRGMNTEDMDQIAEAIASVIKGGESRIPDAKAIVKAYRKVSSYIEDTFYLHIYKDCDRISFVERHVYAQREQIRSRMYEPIN